MKQNEKTSHTLFASGSGFGYLLDALAIIAYKSETKPKIIPNIDIHYTVRCASVINQFHERVERLIDEINMNGTVAINFNWYLTGPEEINEILDFDKSQFNTGNIF